MENRINILFIKEDINIAIDIQQPDLSNLIHKIIGEHLSVSRENIKISTENENFDLKFMGSFVMKLTNFMKI